MDGVINIYKEKGFTSHDVVAVVRKTINQKKVGHTGTLDPDAEGVLPICLGKGTKLADYIMADKKGYRAEVTLGITTTTEDSSGEILEVKPVDFNEEKIKEAVYSFIGEYDQVPPMYSAIKVNGKKLYELAREGKEIERKSRRIKIYDIKILEFLPPNKIVIDVICSKGTYIRTLCSDIGKKLGCGGNMSYLLRTMSGRFNIDTAIKLDELKTIVEKGSIDDILITIDDVLCNYKKVKILPKGTKLLHNGGKMYEYFFDGKYDLKKGEEVLVYDAEGTFIGIFQYNYDKSKEMYCVKPVKILL